MDLLDLVIILLFVVATVSGWRRGISWVGLSMLGLVIGLVVGAALAPPIAHRFGDHVPSTEALIGTGVFLACVAIVQGVGTAAGYRIRVATLRTDLAEFDSGAGSALAAIGVLVVAWYLGLTFSGTSFSRLGLEIRHSAILRALDSVAPRPPGFLLSLQQLLRGQQFPNPFANLAPTELNDVGLPQEAQLRTPGILSGGAAVSKVLSAGCGLEAGSAWPMGGDLWVTNAHVVAGGQRIQLEVPRKGTFDATPVLFDSQVDLAVLRVPNTGVGAMPIAAADPPTGTQGAVIGYPHGGDEQTVAAGVKGTENAEGHDIYGGGLVTRTIEVIQSDVVPGNSGGPLVDLQGQVIGVVFAASTTTPNEGYALALTTVRHDLDQARASSAPVSTGDCAN